MSGMQFLVRIKTIESAKELAAIACKYEDARIRLGHGAWMIDAKSIMGIFSLDLTKPLILDVLTESKDICEQIYNDIQKYII